MAGRQDLLAIGTVFPQSKSPAFAKLLQKFKIAIVIFHWIVFYQVDCAAIHTFNNWDLEYETNSR